MGRPSKNPNHPLVRLRKALSTPSVTMTRAMLAERTGIPEPTLHDIELGKFNLTSTVVMKIATATGVHPQSLSNGDDPLLSLDGLPFIPEYVPDKANRDFLASMPFYEETIRHVFLTAWQTAKEKHKGVIFAYSFGVWLETTLKALALKDACIGALTDKLDSIDPQIVPSGLSLHRQHPEFAPGKHRLGDRKWRPQPLEKGKSTQIKKWRQREEQLYQVSQQFAQEERSHPSSQTDDFVKPWEPYKRRIRCRQKAHDSLRTPLGTSP
jgi:hypothetical protein